MKVRERKKKEADTVNLPQFPEPHQFRTWKNCVYQNIDVASGRTDDKAIRWVKRVANTKVGIRDFAPPVKRMFSTLDKKLSVAVRGLVDKRQGGPARKQDSVFLR